MLLVALLLCCCPALLLRHICSVRDSPWCISWHCIWAKINAKRLVRRGSNTTPRQEQHKSNESSSEASSTKWWLLHVVWLSYLAQCQLRNKLQVLIDFYCYESKLLTWKSCEQLAKEQTVNQAADSLSLTVSQVKGSNSNSSYKNQESIGQENADNQCLYK